MFAKDSAQNGDAEAKKGIEMDHIKNNGNKEKLDHLTVDNSVNKNPEVPEIIGRFRKISSAKNMSNNNGNAKLNEFPVTEKIDGDDAEAGLTFKAGEGIPALTANTTADEADKFIEVSEKVKIVPSVGNRAKITKSSFRNTEKPSRFKDNPSTTRFQMATADGGHTSDEHSGEESDDPLTPHHDSYVQDTKYLKSFRHFTREALPRMDNYRNIMSLHAAYRPTLDELHNATLSGKPGTGNGLQDKGLAAESALKFGWIQGVLVRCLLNIWGVMLFLRLSWVVGQAGIGQAVVLILTTTVVTTITALSMSAISTNGVIKGGGTYYMISRSLGPEFGGSIGLIFSLANAVACAMYVVGFCESMGDLLKSFGSSIVDGGVQDVRIIGSITIVILTVVVVVGMEWEAKAQQGLLVILLVAIVDFVIGTFVGPKSDLEQAKGFIGYNMSLLQTNFHPDYRIDEGVEHNFFSVFAIFFPAATGILAGANISGDLRDPQGSIPKGTLLAIFFTTLSYVSMAVMAGWTVAREATGDLADFANGTYLNCTGKDCQYGLHNSFQVIELVSGFGPLIYAGCFAATLSSALASLVSAPKVFQALCKDKLYPGIVWFAKGYGKNNEPVRGYVLTFFIAICFILIGELNLIAPLISNFFLAAYTLINFSTFHASLAKPVGWRPTFRFYNMWLSLFGAVLCVAVMFLISWWTALLTLSVVLALYLIVSYRKPDVNWGSTTQAQTYKQALLSVQQLNSVTEHVKNYRPQVLVLTGMPGARPPLVHFTYLLTKNLSLMLCGHIIKGQINNKMRSQLNNKAYQWFTKHKVKAFYSLVDDVSFQAGANALIQACGVGKLKPNILLMGFKSDWNKCPKEELTDYVDTLHKALDVHMAIVILRLQEGLNYSHILEDGERDADLSDLARDQSLSKSMAAHRESSESLVVGPTYAHMSQASSVSDMDMSTPASPAMPRATIVSGDPNADDSPNTSNKSTTHNTSTETNGKNQSKMAHMVNAVVDAMGGNTHSGANGGANGAQERRWSQYKNSTGGELPKSTLNTLTYFQRKHGANATIDVWWLYDDGGLTLLLPHIIATRRNWTSCKLRVFTLANKQAELEFEQRNMASLLAKFRIDYSDLTLIPDITKKPQDSSIAYFDKLIADFLVPENPDDPDSAQISDADLLSVRDKTYRYLRLRELLQQHSMGSSLVVMTLPMPRRSLVSAPLYMSWLEVLTSQMPPFLLVRGNHTSVLTFYS